MDERKDPRDFLSELETPRFERIWEPPQRTLKWGIPGRIWALAALFAGAGILLMVIGSVLFGLPKNFVFYMLSGEMLGDAVFILVMDCKPRFGWLTK